MRRKPKLAMLRDLSQITVLFISVLGWAPKPVFLPHHPSFHSAVPFLFVLLFFLITILLYVKHNQESICSIWKKKKSLVDLTAVPGPPSLGSWPEHDGQLCPRGGLTLAVPLECYGTPRSANTWEGLLVITRKLGGTDRFGKHFCRVLLTEKRKGIWYM